MNVTMTRQAERQLMDLSSKHKRMGKHLRAFIDSLRTRALLPSDLTMLGDSPLGSGKLVRFRSERVRVLAIKDEDEITILGFGLRTTE